MAERRIKLSPRQRDALMLAWYELSRAHRKARSQVAGILNDHKITLETPGRLAVEPDGALCFVVKEPALAQADGAP